MEKILFDAVATGNLGILQGLLQEDPLLLERSLYSFFGRTLLHIAVYHGHFEIVQEIVSQNVQLVELPDLQGLTPLHLASAKGHLRIVDFLSSIASDTFFMRDYQGRNPVHVAVVKGNLDVVRFFMEKSPIAAREKTNRNETVLHLCVKHSQFEVLKFLVSEMEDVIDVGDDEGNGILHLAILYQQVEVVRYLVQSTTINRTTKNLRGKAPFELMSKTPSSEIRKILKLEQETLTFTQHLERTDYKTWIDNSCDTIIVVAVLISTMAFQAVITPPGGFDNRIGEPVMQNTNPILYKKFIMNNITAFFASLCTIVMLISGICHKWMLLIWVLIMMMWLSVWNIAGTFVICINAVSRKWEKEALSAPLVVGEFFWFSVMVMIFVLKNRCMISMRVKNLLPKFC